MEDQKLQQELSQMKGNAVVCSTRIDRLENECLNLKNNTEAEVNFKLNQMSAQIAMNNVHNMTWKEAYDYLKELEGKAATHEAMVKRVEMLTLKAKNKRLRQMIERVEFHKPWTIVWWNDGTITRVKKQNGDKWNKEVGLMAAMSKKFYEDTNIFNDEIRKWCN